MDDAGIDIQVLSHGAPSAQRLDAENGPAIARQANDNLHATAQAHPDRFAAFAALATAVVLAATFAFAAVRRLPD